MVVVVVEVSEVDVAALDDAADRGCGVVFGLMRDYSYLLVSSQRNCQMR